MNVQCPDVRLYWPIYLLEVNSSSTVRWSGRPFSRDSVWWCWTGTFSSCWSGCISGISPSCLHGDHGGHASEPVPKDGLVTSCFAGTFWSFGKHWRIALHVHSQLTVCSQCTGAAWHLETDLHQHAEDIPKGWQGDSVQVASRSQWATHSFSSASIAVGVGKSSSQNFMQLRCYILHTWLQLQKVGWDQAESELI